MKPSDCGCDAKKKAAGSCGCAMSDSGPTPEQKKAMIEALRNKGITPIPPDDGSAFFNRPELNIRRLNPSPFRKG